MEKLLESANDLHNLPFYKTFKKIKFVNINNKINKTVTEKNILEKNENL